MGITRSPAKSSLYYQSGDTYLLLNIYLASHTYSGHLSRNRGCLLTKLETRNLKRATLKVNRHGGATVKNAPVVLPEQTCQIQAVAGACDEAHVGCLSAAWPPALGHQSVTASYLHACNKSSMELA